MSVELPPIPTEDRLPAWRRACLAYHEWRSAGASRQEAQQAATAAAQTVLPLPWSDAIVEAEHAIAYAESHQPGWFWRGGDHTKKFLATDASPRYGASIRMNAVLILIVAAQSESSGVLRGRAEHLSTLWSLTCGNSLLRRPFRGSLNLLRYDGGADAGHPRSTRR
jgi:hypothetical protein